MTVHGHILRLGGQQAAREADIKNQHLIDSETTLAARGHNGGDLQNQNSHRSRQVRETPKINTGKKKKRRLSISG